MFIWLLISILVGAGSLWADDKISIRVRIQPRVDFGDITRSADRSTYESEADMYLRRTRLEIVGKPIERLSYVLALSGDRWDQKGRSNAVTVGYALVDYRYSKRLGWRFGVTKLPYSRSALTSSSRQLLIERPAVVGLGTSLLRYFSPHFILYGKLAEGTLAYNFALTDGLQAGDSDRAFSGKEVVQSGNPGVVGRIEYAPLKGWVEGRKSDSHLGQGRHLSLGLNGVFQSGIELEDLGKERRFLLGADLSFHHKNISLLTEYMYMNRDSGVEIEPSGWYVQGGYFIEGLNIEPAVRFDTVNKDANLADVRTKTFTGGLNWYIAGHDLKFQANIFHQVFDKGAREVTEQGTKTGLQIQNQMYF
jgi:hypothetical protein